MRTIFFILCFFLFHCSYSQELDIFQNDSIYAMNKIFVRTMYSVYGKKKQKELVTYYNPRGQKTKQYWFWNGDEEFHNVETFIYLDNGKLTSLIDSIANGNVEKTNYVYENDILKWDITLNQQSDTCEFGVHPNKNETIKNWYREGKPYRIDTTIFEKENVKLEYYGFDNSDSIGWHYDFLNKFDVKGNLISVNLGRMSSTRYLYDSRNLLIKKQGQMQFGGSQPIKTKYIFEYGIRQTEH